jgi:Bacterial inner membrane protein
MQIESLEINQVGQFFGYAGVIANLVWPTMKSREKLLIGQVVACVLMLTHFALLKANTGALVMATAGIQAALAIPLGKHPSFKKIYFASLIATPFVCYATWKGYSSIFFLSGSCNRLRSKFPDQCSQAAYVLDFRYLCLGCTQPNCSLNTRIGIKRSRSVSKYLYASSNSCKTYKHN